MHVVCVYRTDRLNRRQGGWFKKPPYGFDSYNAFFHRQIKLDEFRPLAGKDDDSIIVSANDGQVYAVQNDVKLMDDFWLKGQKYSLINMLDNNETYIERFVGGTVIQSFLSGANYHRWRSPVAGTVLEFKVVPGVMWVGAPVEDKDKFGNMDPAQGIEACQDTRGILYIEADNKKIGTVAVIPVGISEISSITFAHDIGKPLKVGDKIEKGGEIGYFSFGGSSMALVFQKDVLDLDSIVKPDEFIDVRSKIAKVK